MEIVELNDSRLFPIIYGRNYDRKDYYFINARIEGEIRIFLIWPGGDIKLQRAISNKRLGKSKIKDVKLSKVKCRCLVGSYDEYKDNLMSLVGNNEDPWTLYYSSKLDIRVVDKIMDFFQRLIINGDSRAE